MQGDSQEGCEKISRKINVHGDQFLHVQMADTDAGSESSELEEGVVVGGFISARIQIRRDQSNVITHFNGV